MRRKPETIAYWVGRLPHWEVADGRYFATIHVAGAIPYSAQNRIRAEVARLEKFVPYDRNAHWRIQREIFREMESWLDRSSRNPYLANPRIAEMLVEAIDYRSNVGIWRMMEYVVMPNHVHLFFEILRGSLKSVLEGFKVWTGRQAAKLTDLAQDRFWQREWFDRWSRSDAEDERIMAYIRNNPKRARLVRNFHEWPYGSW
jgi:putative transposase